MIALYYFCFSLVLFAAGPFLLFKKKARAGLAQKLGFVAKNLSANKSRLSGCVWFHAVSVGELNAVLSLVKTFHEKYPHIPLVVSTTTATGQALAKEKLAGIAEIFYFPFDLPWITGKYLALLKPRMVVISETEIWPGFSHQCRKYGVKLLVVNGRMSPKSFKSYFRHRKFFAPVLNCYEEIGVQSMEEAKRYSDVAGNVKVRVLGNLKFDGLAPITEDAIAKLRQQINLPPNRFVLVAGSTHEGEETAMLKAYGRMLDLDFGTKGGEQAAQVRLILVPRHPERFDHVAALVDQAGYTVRRFSRGERFADSGREVYLLDVIGRLFDFYSLASVAFVGGTIAPVGGHNIMEPYAYGIPAVVGPDLDKTRDVANTLINSGAITVGKNSEEVIDALLRYFADQESRVKDGAAGRGILNSSQGALGKAMTMLSDNLQETSVALAKR